MQLCRLTSPTVCGHQAGDPGESQWWCSSLEAHWLGDPERVDVSFRAWRQKKIDIPAQRQSGRRNFPLLSGRSTFLFYSGLQLIGWGPCTLGRAIHFTRSISFHSKFMKNTCTKTPTMFDQISGHPVVWSGWHTELTITLSLSRMSCPLWAHVTRWRTGLFKERCEALV